ncbi:hypothetical protein KUTeg_001799, partial [Tegillarca granosa]
MSTGRKFFVGGHWKINGSRESINCGITPGSILRIPSIKLKSDIGVAGQNYYKMGIGPFTGKISYSLILCIYLIGEKVAYALSQGLGVIACIGEKLDEREKGETEAVVYRQIRAFI